MHYTQEHPEGIYCFPKCSLSSDELTISYCPYTIILKNMKISYTFIGDNMIDYSPMFEYMKEHGITQYYLLTHGISNRVLDAVKHGKTLPCLQRKRFAKYCNVRSKI